MNTLKEVIFIYNLYKHDKHDRWFNTYYDIKDLFINKQ